MHKRAIGPLKAFFIIPSLISIIILVTFGYSAYRLSEDMQTLFTTNVPELSFNGTHLIMEGFTLRNSGIYPLSLKIGFNIAIGNLTSETVSQRVDIPPNSVKKMDNIILRINETSLQTAIMNETTLTLTTRVEISIKPLIEIIAQNSTKTKIGPLISVNYNIDGVNDYNSTHMRLSISYDITNNLPQEISGHVKIMIKDTQIYGYGESTLNVPAKTRIHGTIPVFIKKSIGFGTYNAVITLTVNGITKTSTLSVQIP
ncbi:MAG: hypothetical protein QW128_02960 [Thermoprotei archaeon]